MMKGVVYEEFRTELDPHTNIPVLARHAYVLSDNEKTADVSAYSLE